MNEMTGPGLGRDDEDPNDPAVAFQQLTHTVNRLSEDVQVLTRTILADRIQRQEELQEIGRRIQAIHAADPRADLGQVGRELVALSKHVETLSRQPLLAKGAEHLETVVTRAGARVARDTSAEQQAVMSDFRFVASDLKEQTKRLRTRKRQQWWVGGAAGYAFALGFLFYPLVATTLPNGNYLAVAARQMDHWQVIFTVENNIKSSEGGFPKTEVEIRNSDEDMLGVCTQVLRKNDNRQQICEKYNKSALIVR